MKELPKRVRAEPRQVKSDIVFCVDSTASMRPCIDGVKDGLQSFTEGLQSAANLDFRLRLIAYRDLHDPTCRVDFELFEFTESVEEFGEQLNQIEAKCYQEHRGAESALDALYLAIHSDWRPARTHKAIVLLSDDNTWPTLHPTTYPETRPDNDVGRVIQDLQTLDHALLYLVVPRYETYDLLQEAMGASPKLHVVAHWVPKYQEDPEYEGLRAIDWHHLMEYIGRTVSATSIVAIQEPE